MVEEREQELLDQLMNGDKSVLGELFAIFRARLRYMVRLRMDNRLKGRVSPSDVLQESFLEASNRIDKYLENPNMPFHLWLRFLTSQQILAAYRRHLGAQMRSAGQEVAIFQGAPQASSECIAAQLIGAITSPSQAVAREEIKQRLQDALNRMEPIDREILTLRHFEELSNNEVAQLLNLKKSAASNRYIRALKRLKDILREISELDVS